MSEINRPYTQVEELRELSFKYNTDGYQFAVQAEILLNEGELVRRCQYHIGYLSKISVMLYMSIECSLKSMICSSHMQEAPKSVYWKRIRPAGHSFTKLLKEIPDFSAKISDPSLLAELNRLMDVDVSERYCLEVSSESDLLGEMNIDSAKLQEKIAEANHLLEIAMTIRRQVWDIRTAAFKSHRTLPPDKVKDVLRRIKTK